jgi:hypothetical protein
VLRHYFTAEPERESKRESKRERERERERDSLEATKYASFICTGEQELERARGAHESQNKSERERERESCFLAPHFTNWYIIDFYYHNAARAGCIKPITRPAGAALNP